MKKVRFGIIGCGKIVDCNHIPEIKEMGDGAEIVSMYDIKPGVAQAMAEKHQLMPLICSSEEELLASDIDAVIIATPNSFHYPQTLRAIAAGKNVLVEKPMASRIEDGDAMIDAAKKSGVTLHVNQSIFYIPSYIEIKKMIDAGEIGKPLHIRSQRCSTNSPDVSWSPGATWFVSKEFEGSLVTDIGVHMASMMEWYFGEVAQISSITRNSKHEVPDNVVAIFDFVNGATGSLELSWTFPVNTNKLEVYGEDGYILMDKDIEVYDKENKLVKKIITSELPKTPNSHMEFAESVELQRDSWMYGRKALALCIAVNESNQKGVAVKPQLRGQK